MLTFLAVLLPMVCPAPQQGVPFPDEFQRGVVLYREAKGLERVLAEDRQPIGWWSDGLKREAVESVIWISPRLVSRWLGFLWAQEKWPEGEALRRWESVRPFVEGRSVFVVQLSDLPRKDVSGEEEPTRLRSSQHTFRLALTSGGDWPQKKGTFRLDRARRFQGSLVNEPLEPTLISQAFAREWAPLKATPWYMQIPELAPLWPEFSLVDSDDALPLGRYRTRFYTAFSEVKVPVGDSFEVRVFRPGKESVARFAVR